MRGKKEASKKTSKQTQRPFAKSDFEAVLKSATKPLKKESGLQRIYEGL